MRVIESAATRPAIVSGFVLGQASISKTTGVHGEPVALISIAPGAKPPKSA